MAVGPVPTAPRCAELPNVRGRWERRAAPRYATANASFQLFAERFRRVQRPGQSTGLECSASRATYDFLPRGCELPDFDPGAACRLLGGRQIMMVGDSTGAQLFLSLVLLLGGRFGRMPGAGIGEATAVAPCPAADGGAARLAFARADVPMWTADSWHYYMLTSCDPNSLGSPFVARAARDADLLVFTFGHHLPRLLPFAERPAEYLERTVRGLLASAIAARARFGYAPSSLVVLGPPQPMPNCTRFGAPLGAADAARAAANASSTHAHLWRRLPYLNALLRTVATDLGAAFVDIAALSAQRPDAAVGHFQNRSHAGGFARRRRRRPPPPPSATNASAANASAPPVPAEPDCLHTCLPGPADTWNRLLLDAIAHAEPPSPRPPPPPDGAGGSPAAGGRFFALNESCWLGKLSTCADRVPPSFALEKLTARERRLVAPQHLPHDRAWPFRAVFQQPARAGWAALANASGANASQHDYERRKERACFREARLAEGRPLSDL